MCIRDRCHTYLNRRQIIFCNPPFKGPERNICLWQLRSAPGPEGPEACWRPKCRSLPVCHLFVIFLSKIPSVCHLFVVSLRKIPSVGHLIVFWLQNVAPLRFFCQVGWAGIFFYPTHTMKINTDFVFNKHRFCVQ